MSNFSQAVDLVIKSEINGIPRHEMVLELGKTPQYILNSAGVFTDLDLIITGKVISKACFDHCVPTSTIQRLPEIVNSPKALFRSANQDTQSVVVMTFEVVNSQHPLIVPIHPNKPVGRQRVCNAVASLYGKEGHDPHEKWTRAGLLLWKK